VVLRSGPRVAARKNNQPQRRATVSDLTSASASTARSEQDVRALIRNLILELAPNPDGARPDQAALLIDDLEYHSLALIELAFTLEDEFDLEPIDETTATQIVTARDVEEFVLGKLRERGDVSAD
jgi:acyl carrier protein